MGADGSDGRATLREIFLAARDWGPAGLSSEELHLWLLYRSYETAGRGGFPGDERLARHLDRSPRSVQEYRANLLEAGYLEQQLRGPKPARYRAILPDEADDGETIPWGLGEIPQFKSWNGEASSYFVDGVRKVLWRSKQPPPDAPDGWTIGADLKRLKVAFENLGAAGTVRRLWGLRYLADDGELTCRGPNGDLRRLEPGEGFTLGLLDHYREEGKWGDAERRYWERHGGEDEEGEELAEAVAFAQGHGGEA